MILEIILICVEITITIILEQIKKIIIFMMRIPVSFN